MRIFVSVLEKNCVVFQFLYIFILVSTVLAYEVDNVNIHIPTVAADDPTDEADTFGVRIESNNDAVRGYEENGLVVVEPNADITVRLFGHKFEDVETVFVTTSAEDCSDEKTVVVPQQSFQMRRKNALAFSYTFPDDESMYYFCFSWYGKPHKDGTSNDTHNTRLSEKVHQGSKEWQHVMTRKKIREYYLPMPLQIVIILILLILSGLFSGLNLGLMSLDKTELEIILKVGEKRERSYAQKIYPVRRTGNYLLCSLLLGNVIVNSAISILFDDLTSGFIALIFSSLGIVVFGEIVPQAVCSRYGLAVGAYTIYITRFFMLLTAPLSWPISKILDWALGEEVGVVYDKERLLELIRLSKDREGELQNCQEVQIVTGALELSRKCVRDVMTNIKDVYMLPSDTILDPMMVSEIVKSGYTRIPVYDPANRHNVAAMLNVKDLALLDPEDKIPLATICKFYQHPVRYVMEDTPLNVMLEEFKKGHYHLAIVQRINNEGEGDPTYDIVGLVTLEDILEEIIQAEIMDEFDVIRNNRRRVKRKETMAIASSKDVTSFFYNADADLVDISSQLTLATYQYLSTTLEAFRGEIISEQVLQRLIKQNVIRARPADAYEPVKFLYQKNKECDHFVLILEGKATITVGESEMMFEPGPFHYFGYEVLHSMLVQAPRFSVTTVDTTPVISDKMRRRCTFAPDFTVKITHDLVYLKVTASTYLKALRATMIERRISLTGVQPLSSLMNSPDAGTSNSHNNESDSCAPPSYTDIHGAHEADDKSKVDVEIASLAVHELLQNHSNDNRPSPAGSPDGNFDKKTIPRPPGYSEVIRPDPHGS